MNIEKIIQAFENLRYFESTCEVEWGRVQAEADIAIKTLKQGQSLPIDSVSQQRELLVWLQKSDLVTFPKDEINEVIDDYRFYQTNGG